MTTKNSTIVEDASQTLNLLKKQLANGADLTERQEQIIDDAAQKLNFAERLANDADLAELSQELAAELKKRFERGKLEDEIELERKKLGIERKVNATANILSIIVFVFCCYLFWG